MILIIDTTKRSELLLGLINDKVEKWKKLETTRQSKEILSVINSLIKESDSTLNDLKAVFVNRGPGSYTGLRVGIAVANTLAWALNIQTIGYLDEKMQEALDKFKTKPELKFQGIAKPYYDRQID